MDLFIHHKILQTDQGEVLDLYLNPQFLFSKNQESNITMPKVSIDHTVKRYIQTKLPEIKALCANVKLESNHLGTVKLKGV